MTQTSTVPELAELIAGAELPALPQSAIRLLELSKDPANGPDEFALPIDADPGLTGQVLRFVNSSYFGFGNEISSVKSAITMVGIRTIKNFALWNAVFTLIPNPKCGPFDLSLLWQDSLRRALCARAVGQILQMPDADELFTAGLLQDMALPILAKELPEKYEHLLEMRGDGLRRLSDLEDAEFGWNHADAGAQLVQAWKLPESFADCIQTHTKLSELLAGGEASPGQVSIALSSMLPSVCDEIWADRNTFIQAFQRITGSVEKLPELFALLDRDYEEFSPILRVSVPSRSLYDWLEDVGGDLS